MYFFKKFYLKTIKYILINKFIYKKLQIIPKLKKIVLNFSSKTTDMKKLFTGLLALELITNQKGILTNTKTFITSIKIRKGNPVGCKLTIQKNKIFKILNNIIFKILPKLQNIKKFILNQIKKNTLFFNFKLYNIFNFSELEKHYYFFKNLFELNITIILISKKKREFIFFCKLFQFLYLKSK